MSEPGHVELLTPANNYAVVALPGRAFPGVVFQGDSVLSMLQDLRRIHSEMLAGSIDDAAVGLSDLEERLQAVLSSYTAVLRAAGRALPFPDPSTS